MTLDDMIAQRDALLQPVSAACARGALLLLALIQRNFAPLCRELALPAPGRNFHARSSNSPVDQLRQTHCGTIRIPQLRAMSRPHSSAGLRSASPTDGRPRSARRSKPPGHHRPRRSRTRRTCIGNHWPPFGAAMPRVLRSVAMALLDVRPVLMQRSMCGRSAWARSAAFA